MNEININIPYSRFVDIFGCLFLVLDYFILQCGWINYPAYLCAKKKCFSRSGCGV
nr:MAG TPA: hypothetical protein [Caudoviricetes sp.]